MNDPAPPGQIPVQEQEQEQGEQAKKIQAIHDEVKTAKDAMEITAMKLQERGELMDDLQHKTGTLYVLVPFLMAFVFRSSLFIEGVFTNIIDKLSIQSQNFKSTAAKTRRRMWIQNMKVGHILMFP
jgi:hypothetical protein